MSWAAPDYVDGTWTAPIACGMPEFSAPIPGDSTEYMFTQPWMATRNVYDAIGGGLALNTAHPVYTTFVLVSESESKRSLGNGIVQWTRTYAKKPSSWDDWGTIAFAFPGTAPIGPLTSAQAGRAVMTWPVNCRIHREYFLIAASGGDYTTPGAIPVTFKFSVCAQDTIGVTDYGGWWAKQDYLYNGPSFLQSNVGQLWKTTPTQDQYLSMMKLAYPAGGSAGDWTSAVVTQVLTTDTPPKVNLAASNFAGGQLCAEDSKLDRWIGNIWCRSTSYVLAR